MSKKRILIVDDEPDFTRPLKEFLERTGNYEVREENKGLRAYFTAQEFRPDLVLLDIMMLDIDGSEVADQLREDPLFKSTPIIFLTGVITRSEAQERGGFIGGHPFIAKPVSLREVLVQVQHYMPKPPSDS